MDRAEFWLSDLEVERHAENGPRKMRHAWRGRRRRAVRRFADRPGWGEMTVFEHVPRDGPFSKRDWLLGWVIACVNEQFGFALDLCRRAHVAMPDPLFVKPGGRDRTA